MDERTVGICYVLASAVGFGTVGIFGTLGGDVGLSIPTILAFRFAIASAILWSLLAVQGRQNLLGGRLLGWAALLGIGGYGGMSGFYFWGLEHLTAGLVAIVLFTFPAIVVAVTLVTSPGRISGPLVAALCLSLGGVALIVGADPAGADPRGVIIVLCSAVCYAGYMLGSERVLESVDPQALTAHVLPASGLLFLAIGAARGTFAVPAATETTAWVVLVALGLVSTAIPISLLYAGLSRIGASRASILSTVEPAVAVVLGAAVLDEPVTATTVLGGVLVVGGVVVIQRRS
ncbi:EamA family transporter [Haloterrigena sp. SYSU A558-1]|uniref:EamA family transporter n=1 Tax=Haloterrigena gelatinilytica TaxID=2741724 RepID=A0A8J8GQK0_9EURY|nr:DMT family transporter [Haloterrigena gelatinilytica]NUB91715.1 EamA family transporter [Haloterrigena gelatinilytica]NUC72458.1 EamA family transporter [Haloterrigena gelatinilytica]